ncbi:uncharacterized protein HMPREF1541_08582 [Cyphellophora europaea CBS 101466]|uniref:MYND-type domain-containing protein n=1 Tax=Cyphellophora europaea (strain CBS 101466) TaxID=1220924 RepID=W2RIY7_CYPE1|nr:uncharacterized protein HMPREF1541_08582 [Cyphellophora europaea CBS 101466]ETN36305.1 hypothetical protein HMPREF1541_08582 [Cyphellophora europaea CBS 101466]
MDLIAGTLSDDLKINVNFIDDPDHYDCEHSTQSKSTADTRRHLNEGHFTRVFNKYKATQHVDLLLTGPHACVILSAKAMNVGANISSAQREYLRSIYKKCGLHKEGIEQMGKALDEYINGTPYELKEPDRTDHNIQMAFDEARSKNGSGFTMMNYHGPRYYEEGVPTHDWTHAMVKGIRRKKGEPAYFPGAPVLRECRNCDKFPEQVDGGLKACGKCKKVMYCGRDCQKSDWANHKKFCKAFAKMPAPPAVESLQSSPMCIPGYDPLAKRSGPNGGPTPDGATVYTASAQSNAHTTQSNAHTTQQSGNAQDTAGTGSASPCSTQ